MEEANGSGGYLKHPGTELRNGRSECRINLIADSSHLLSAALGGGPRKTRACTTLYQHVYVSHLRQGTSSG